MASSIKSNGVLPALDLLLVSTSKHTLLKVENPSSRVEAVRPASLPNVLDVIRAKRRTAKQH